MATTISMGVIKYGIENKKMNRIGNIRWIFYLLVF